MQSKAVESKSSGHSLETHIKLAGVHTSNARDLLGDDAQLIFSYLFCMKCMESRY